MPQTSISSATAYATPAQLLQYYEIAKVAEWASDNEALTYDQITAPDPNVAQALLTASGIVESYCIRGGRYLPTDLAVLTGASQAFLVKLVCDLAMYELVKRRAPEPEKIVAGYKEAQETLKSLANGDMIFSFQETASAGNMVAFDTKYNSAGCEQRLTDIARPFFGRRANSYYGPRELD